MWKILFPQAWPPEKKNTYTYNILIYLHMGQRILNKAASKGQCAACVFQPPQCLHLASIWAPQRPPGWPKKATLRLGVLGVFLKCISNLPSNCVLAISQVVGKLKPKICWSPTLQFHNLRVTEHLRKLKPKSRFSVFPTISLPGLLVNWNYV